MLAGSPSAHGRRPPRRAGRCCRSPASAVRPRHRARPSRAISSATIVLNSTERGRSVEPVRVSRRRMMSKIGISALGAALNGDRHVASVLGQAGEVARHIIAADHVDDDVDAAPIGDAVHLLDEVLRPVVDRRVRAELERPRAFGVAFRRSRSFAARTSCPSAIAIVPMPLVPPCTSTQSPSAAKPRSNRLTQTVNRVSGIAAASTSDSASRNGQAGARRRDAIFGIAAAGDQRADLLPDQRARRRARRDDFSRDLEPEDVGRAGRRRIEAPALQYVGPVDPGRGDLDQDFVRARPRHRPLDHRQLVRAVGCGATTALIDGGKLGHGAGLLTARPAGSTIPPMDLDELFPSKPGDPLVELAQAGPRSDVGRGAEGADRSAESRDRPRRSAHAARPDHRSAAEELFKKP